MAEKLYVIKQIAFIHLSQPDKHDLAFVETFGGARQARMVCLSLFEALPQEDKKVSNME